MLPVPESSAREQNGKIVGVVHIRIAEVAAIEHHGAVEETTPLFASVGKALKMGAQDLHLPAIDTLELRDLFL